MLQLTADAARLLMLAAQGLDRRPQRPARKADVERFRKLVGTDSGVEVRLRDWYPK